MTPRTLPYADRLKAHLARYKRDTLEMQEDGLWSRNQRAYPHILPARHQQLNFLAPLRDQLLDYLQRQGIFHYHRDFHHLTSSQAMCLNLMFPVITSDAVREAFSSVLGAGSPLDPDTARFEWVADPAEGTNFDFLIRTAAGGSIYFEFKLTESKFGTASADERHLAKLSQIYSPRLAGLVGPELLQPEDFFPRYQLLRNLSFVAKPDDLFVIVLPRAHLSLAKQANAFLADLPEVTRQRVRLAYMEDIAQAFRSASVDDKPVLTAHLDEFTAKYCID